MTFDEALTMVRNELNKALKAGYKYLNAYTASFYKYDAGPTTGRLNKEVDNLRFVLNNLEDKIQKNEITTCSDLINFLNWANNYVVITHCNMYAGIQILSQRSSPQPEVVGIYKEGKDAISECLKYLKQPATSMTP